MQVMLRLHPWDIRRLTFDEFRRRCEFVLQQTESREGGMT